MKHINRLKVASIGASRVDNKLLDYYRDPIKNIAESINNKNALLFNGACHGYPMILGEEAVKIGVEVIGFSPASNIKEHVDIYNSPLSGFTNLYFSGNGLSGREVDMIRQSEIVLAIGGNAGTLCEILISIKEKKTY